MPVAGHRDQHTSSEFKRVWEQVVSLSHTHAHSLARLAGQNIKIVLVADYYCKNAHSSATYPHKAAAAGACLPTAPLSVFSFRFPFFHTLTHTHTCECAALCMCVCSCNRHVSKCVEKEKKRKKIEARSKKNELNCIFVVVDVVARRLQLAAASDDDVVNSGVLLGGLRLNSPCAAINGQTPTPSP